MREDGHRASARFGKNLKKVLDLRNMTVLELAKKLGVETKQIYNLINSAHDSRIKSFEKVANALGYSTWQLLALDVDELPAQHSEVLHLLELFSRADEAGRKVILQVAEVAATKGPSSA